MRNKLTITPFKAMLSHQIKLGRRISLLHLKSQSIAVTFKTDADVHSFFDYNRYHIMHARALHLAKAKLALLSSWLKMSIQQRDGDLGPYAPQGSTTLLPKLSVTSKVSARTSCAWVGSRVCFRSSEDVTLLEFTSPVDREYMRRCQKFH